MARIGILYYSMYGQTYDLAQALAKGVADAGGEVGLRRAPETLPQEVVDAQGLQPIIDRQADAETASVDELPSFDGLLIGGPTRYGSTVAQLQNFLDQTGALWAEGKLVGKAAGFFTGAATIHGGHESTLLGMSTFAFHHGMVIVPAGYAIPESQSTRTGGGPYGPTHFAPQDGSKPGLSDEEIAFAGAYGRHFHGVAAKLAA